MSNKVTPKFVTSDWHIGHKAVLELDNRPFHTLREMHRHLINNYNSTVPENGICYFLGDVGLCSGTILKEVVAQLHGKKVLILGNHDHGSQKFLDMGFDLVLYGAMLHVAKQIVTLSHCPLRGIKREDITGMKGAKDGEMWHGESRHGKYSFPDFGQYHLHGHIHSPNGGKSTKIQGKQFDVGVVANKYKPVNFSVIEAWIVGDRK